MEYGGYTEKVLRAERMLKGQIEDMRLKERIGDGQTESHVELLTEPKLPEDHASF